MFSRQYQMTLPDFHEKQKYNRQLNRLDERDKKFHDWYRFVLSFPPRLVRDYLEDFGINNQHKVLDPFCGTGTTLVECKLRGIECIGVEAAPFAHFASSVKTDWNIKPDRLKQYAEDIADNSLNELKKQGIDDCIPFSGDIKKISLKTLEAKSEKLLIKNSVSPLPLHKVLTLLAHIEKKTIEPYYRYALLALAKALVFFISNLHFGPEVGVKNIKDDVPVISAWLSEMNKMTRDIKSLIGRTMTVCKVFSGDSRHVGKIVPPNSIDAVITSPPYPNEKDYSRTTRLESVILGFMKDRSELRSFKKNLIRSNTRGVYKGDDDDIWIADNKEINSIAERIEKRRIELGKNSGFERLYAAVTRLYFGGMARHLSALRAVLKPGAKLAYVVGDQASYLRIMIRTGQILADIARSSGYEVVRTDLFRTRQSTATKSELREEVLILQWNG